MARKSERNLELFESLAGPHLEAAYRFALNLTRHKADAEDIVQDACRIAFEKFHLFEIGTNFKNRMPATLFWRLYDEGKLGQLEQIR